MDNADTYQSIVTALELSFEYNELSIDDYKELKALIDKYITAINSEKHKTAQ
jgi:hypothetical protein